MKRYIKNGVFALTLLSVGGFSSIAVAEVESEKPIRIAINEWTGQHLSANIAGELLKKMGYQVQLVTAGALPQFTAIAQNELDLNPEVWDNSVTDIYTDGLASGKIVNLGDLGLEPKEGWIYPPYMAEKCPGLPAYQALYDCAEAFASAETFPNGRLVAYPADWGTRSAAVIDAIDLPFTAVPGGSEGAMIAELKSAIASEEPILMMMWQPHWLFSQFELDSVEWNPIEGECVEETQERETACGFAQASVNKIVSSQLAVTWPGAAAFIEKFTLTNAEQNAMIFEVDQGGRALEEVVQEWIDTNETKWSAWIK